VSEQKLPMVEGNGGAAPAAPPRQVEASSVRLVGTLAVAGALAGMAIVMVFQWAKPRIDKHKAEVLAAAVTEVLGGAKRYETVFLDGDHFTTEPQADTAGLDRVYVGYDENGRPRGVAMEAQEAGFQDIIDLLFGFDPSTGDVIGMKVLTSNETPGLGAKITYDSTFIGEFNGVGTPLLGVKKDRAKGEHDEVIMITGATISSRAVIKIINDRLDAIEKPVDTYWSTLAPAAATSAAAKSGGSVTNEASGGGL
jgi:electron transport complex protein RnfG